MAGMSVSVSAKWSGTPRAKERIALVLAKLAQDFAAGWKTNIVAVGSVDTGAYLNSVIAEPDGEDGWIVHDGVDYGVFNEFGTYKMAARPAAQPAFAAIAAAAPAAFRGVFE